MAGFQTQLRLLEIPTYESRRDALDGFETNVESFSCIISVPRPFGLPKRCQKESP